jgi:prevent-host-death family protein
MKVVTSVEAQNHFGELLDNAQRQPIKITRRGRTVAFVISPEEYLALSQGIETAHSQALRSAAHDAVVRFRGSGPKGATQALLADRNAERLRDV